MTWRQLGTVIYAEFNEATWADEVRELLEKFPIGTEVVVEPITDAEEDLGRKGLRYSTTQTRARAVIVDHDPTDWELPFYVRFLEEFRDDAGTPYDKGENAYVARVALPLEVPTFNTREEADEWLSRIASQL